MRPSSPDARKARRSLATVAFLLVAQALAPPAPVPAAPPPDRYKTERLRGRVVWMADALREHLGLEEIDSQARQFVLALVTDQGEILPIVEDPRGRAFRRDERLRNIHVELLVRRFDKTPVLQVLRVFEVRPDGTLAELVYWCDVCAITLFENKPCDCCQGPVQLQRRPVSGQ